MKITLISPKLGTPGLASLSFFKVPPLGLIQLASLTPENHEVEIIDEETQDIDFDKKTDLVGLTGTTCLAPRAYQIASEFRKRRVPTIMGGVHASVMAAEANLDVDSVVVGEAENIWPKILADAQKKKLEGIYFAQRPENLDFPVKRRVSRILNIYPSRLLPIHRRFAFLQVSRGCPFDCEFCSVTKFNGPKIRHKSIDYIIAEIEREKNDGAEYFVFVDDDLVADKRFALELFKAMTPLNIRWMTQADIRIGNKEFLDAACKSGMQHVFCGLESIKTSTLTQSMSPAKGAWRKDYETMVKNLRNNGVIFEAGFMFGNDNDDPGVVEKTVDWATDNKIDIAQFSITTSLPGTKLYERRRGAGQLITGDWSLYDGIHCVFCSTRWPNPAELEEKWKQAYRRFYSVPSIIRRVWAKSLSSYGLTKILGVSLVNLDFRGLKL